MKILIIEDEKDLREVMTRSLEKERFVVETAVDYPSALQKINDYDYDCILLDIMLPGGSGLSILEELKKLRKRESVIIVSAKDSIEDKVLGLEQGADDYLPKPFHLAELNARIKSVLRRQRGDGSRSPWQNYMPGLNRLSGVTKATGTLKSKSKTSSSIPTITPCSSTVKN